MNSFPMMNKLEMMHMAQALLDQANVLMARLLQYEGISFREGFGMQVVAAAYEVLAGYPQDIDEEFYRQVMDAAREAAASKS